MQRVSRMKRELVMLSESPPHGVSCWSVEDSLDQLQAQIIGTEGTPYHNGVFKLEIHIPDRYPFEPPKMRFITPIYHPNIDTEGRICLDSLKMPPKGAWKPALNLGTLLTSIQQLMNEPNPDDPLMTDIANEFRFSRTVFTEKARQWTDRHAMQCHDQVENKENVPSASQASKHHAETSEDSSSDSDNDDIIPHKKRALQNSVVSLSRTNLHERSSTSSQLP